MTAANAFGDDLVVLNAPIDVCVHEPRYRDDQVEQRYGAFGSLN